jgi:uncharacterized Ntn-hydrolase superfamily protein
MYASLLLMISLLFLSGLAHSQDTFSIVAVDTLTGEVGSAGASCIAGSIILSDVHPGVGVIHTQSYWNAANQNYARTLMNQGYSPDQIIDSLVANDAQGNPTIRQYGIIDLIDGGRSAGYTGVNCFDYKNHILGPVYTVAGNILMGQQILDSMEARFINTQGMLSDRLMAALQGAKVPGADTRCLAAGTSSISAFIRVARPEDTTGVLFLDLNVNNAPTGVEPIDSLQALYDEWRMTVGVSPVHGGRPEKLALHQNYPNPFNPVTTIVYDVDRQQPVTLTIYDLLGREVVTLVDETKAPGQYVVTWDATGRPSGIYLYRMMSGSFAATRKLLLLR